MKSRMELKLNMKMWIEIMQKMKKRESHKKSTLFIDNIKKSEMLIWMQSEMDQVYRRHEMEKNG